MWRRSALVAAVLCQLALPHVASGDEARPPVANIVHGVTTEDYPAVGALIDTSQGTPFTKCTATLIGCDTVLTAAHCFCTSADGTLAPAAVCANSGLADYWRTNSIFALQNAGAFTIKSVVIHPDFQPYQPMGTFALVGDLAVLTLDAATTGIPPARINTESPVPMGSQGTIVGFGAFTPAVAGDSPTGSGLKRRGTITTAPCEYGGTLYERLLCWNDSGQADSATCHGDSGGPLFVDLASGLEVAGVTSGGVSDTCQPGLNWDADVYSYRAWIAQQAGADLNSTRCGDVPQLGELGAHSESHLGVLSIFDQADSYPVEIPPNTAEVRFALNGLDDAAGSSIPNTFDLVVTSPPAAAQEFDCGGPSGPYGFCVFEAPAPGNWSATVLLRSGLGPYQLSVTTFAEAVPTATFTATPSATPTATVPPAPTSTRPAPSPTRTLTRTATALPTHTPSATATPGLCEGDCNDDGVVTVAEIILGVNIDLGTASPAACSAFDPGGAGTVTIDVLVRAINSLLNGCRRAPIRSPTATATQTASTTGTASPAPTITRTATATPTVEPSPTRTLTSTAIASTTATPSGTAPATDTASVTPTATATPSPSSTATAADSPSPTATSSQSPTESATATATLSPTPDCPATPISVASALIPAGGYVFESGGEHELETLGTTAQPLAGCDELSVTVALSAAGGVSPSHIALRLSTDDAPDIIKDFAIGDANNLTAIELQGDYPGLAPGPHLFRLFASTFGYTVISTGSLQVQSP